VFADGREQYLLSALCRLYILHLSSKSGGSSDELAAWFGNPAFVQMRVPTEEELKKFAEKKINRDKNAYRGLLAIAQTKGVKVKEVSHQEFYKEFEDVY